MADNSTLFARLWGPDVLVVDIRGFGLGCEATLTRCFPDERIERIDLSVFVRDVETCYGLVLKKAHHLMELLAAAIVGAGHISLTLERVLDDQDKDVPDIREFLLDADRKGYDLLSASVPLRLIYRPRPHRFTGIGT